MYLQDDQGIFLAVELEPTEPAVRLEEKSGSKKTGGPQEELHLTLEEVHAALEVMNKKKEALQLRM